MIFAKFYGRVLLGESTRPLPKTNGLTELPITIDSKQHYKYNWTPRYVTFTYHIDKSHVSHLDFLSMHRPNMAK